MRLTAIEKHKNHEKQENLQQLLRRRKSEKISKRLARLKEIEIAEDPFLICDFCYPREYKRTSLRNLIRIVESEELKRPIKVNELSILIKALKNNPKNVEKLKKEVMDELDFHNKYYL
jgi:hypothetical protein